MSKFILTQKELHLGHIKETFGAGAVIEHDEEKNCLIVDGRKFEDTRDLDILKRQADKYPHKPFIVPYSEEALVAIREAAENNGLPQPKRANVEPMKVIKSDEDLMEPIDIRDTQVSKRNQEAKEEARTAVKNRDKNRKLEVIRGDESVEDRIARLQDEAAARKAAGKATDLSAQKELVDLKSKNPQKAPIVRDDSLGSAAGSSSPTLNSGTKISGKRSDEADVKAQAEARKQEIEKNREAAGVDVPAEAPQEAQDASGGVVSTEVDQDVPDGTLADSEGDNADMATPPESAEDIDAQIAALQAKKAALAEPTGKDVERVPVTDGGSEEG